MERIVGALYRVRYYVPLIAVVIGVFAAQYHIAEWLLAQVMIVLRGFLVSPIAENQSRDLNFWGGVVIGFTVVFMGTWLVLTHRGWQAYLLENVFTSPLQKGLYRHFFMQSLEDATFLFVLRQTVVLMSWLLVPSAVKGLALGSFGSYLDAARYFVDARMATLLLIVASLAWYAASTGLWQLPLDPMGRLLTTGLLKSTLYCGVALTKTYGILNAQGVTLAEFLVLASYRYPLVMLALGAATVEPAERVGRWIRSQWGVTLGSIAGINAINVATMLWSGAAGKYVGELIAYDYASKSGAISDNGSSGIDLGLALPVEVLARLLVLMLCGALLWLYGHAVYLLYYSSPLLACEFDVPRVTRVEFLEGGKVVDKVWALYSNHMEGSVNKAVAAVGATIQAIMKLKSSDKNGVDGGPLAVPVPLSSPSGSGTGPQSPSGVEGAVSAQDEDTMDRVLRLSMDLLDVAVSLQSLADGEEDFGLRVTAKVRARNETGRDMVLPPCAVDVHAAAATTAPATNRSRPAGGSKRINRSGLPLSPVQAMLKSAGAVGAGLQLLPALPDTYPLLTMHLLGFTVPAVIEGNNQEAAVVRRVERDGGASPEADGVAEVEVTMLVYLHVANVIALLQEASPSSARLLSSTSSSASPSSFSLLRGVSTLLATLYVESPLAEGLVFSVPLLTWVQGQWRNIGLLDPPRYAKHLDVSQLMNNRSKLRGLAESLSQRRASAALEEMSQLPAEAQDDVARLLLLLQRINARGNTVAAAGARALAEQAATNHNSGPGAATGKEPPTAATRPRPAKMVGPAAASAAVAAAAALPSSAQVARNNMMSSEINNSNTSLLATDQAQQPSVPRPLKSLFSYFSKSWDTVTASATARDASTGRVMGSGASNNENSSPGPAEERDRRARAIRNRPLIAEASSVSLLASSLRLELPDLLRALYLLISIRRKLSKAGVTAPSRALSPLLLELSSSILHLCYDTVGVEWAGGRRDPMHLLMLSGGVLGMQAVWQALQPASTTAGTHIDTATAASRRSAPAPSAPSTSPKASSHQALAGSMQPPAVSTATTKGHQAQRFVVPPSSPPLDHEQYDSDFEDES